MSHGQHVAWREREDVCAAGESVRRTHRRQRRWTPLLAATGVLPLFGLVQTPPTTALLIYSVFVVLWLLRRPWERVLAGIRRPALAFVGLVLCWGWLAELFAWTNEYLARDPEPALFHPQLLPDLMLVSGLFLGWAVAWLVAFRLGAWTLGGVFATTGILGIVIEENGVVLRAMLAVLAANPVQAIIIGLYVFALYGAVPGLALLGLEARLCRGERRRWWQVPAALVLLFVCGKVGAWLVRIGADAASLVPPPRPIWE